MRLSRRPAARLAWGQIVAAMLLVLQASADTAAALPHPEDLDRAPTTLEAHHTAQCIPVHDPAQCAQCQYHATRSLPAPQRRIRFATEEGRRIVGRGQPQPPNSHSRQRAISPRAPPLLPS